MQKNGNRRISVTKAALDKARQEVGQVKARRGKSDAFGRVAKLPNGVPGDGRWLLPEKYQTYPDEECQVTDGEVWAVRLGPAVVQTDGRIVRAGLSVLLGKTADVYSNPLAEAPNRDIIRASKGERSDMITAKDIGSHLHHRKGVYIAIVGGALEALEVVARRQGITLKSGMAVRAVAARALYDYLASEGFPVGQTAAEPTPAADPAPEAGPVEAALAEAEPVMADAGPVKPNGRQRDAKGHFVKS